MSQYREDDELAGALGQVVQLVLWLLARLVFGVFIVSQWLTRLLFEYVLNPLTEGFFERHDGAVVLTAAGLWTVVAGGILFPLAVDQGWAAVPAQEWVQGLWWSLGTGCLWGCAIGGWLVMTWWAEIEERAPATAGFAQTLNLRQEHYLPEGSSRGDGNGSAPAPLSLEDIERLYAGGQEGESSPGDLE